MSVTFPGESAEYRAARERLLARERAEQLCDVQRDFSPGLTVGIADHCGVTTGFGARKRQHPEPMTYRNTGRSSGRGTTRYIRTRLGGGPE